MEWPEGKKFAFTIVDDTDHATVANVKPVYDLLKEIGLTTTKTVWVYPPKDRYTGASLQDSDYLEFIRSLQKSGFEIALHGVGSGDFSRDEIEAGIREFRALLGEYPQTHINHGRNSHNILWGHKRFAPPLSWLLYLANRRHVSHGDDPTSHFFWGDLCQQHIRFIRNHAFGDINTLRCDPWMPYRVRSKDACSNFWFSSSDGHVASDFVRMTEKTNVNRLMQERGCCIMYTHFACGFVDEKMQLDRQFEDQMRYLASQSGWFVPANQLLNWLSTQQSSGPYLSWPANALLDFRWLGQRLQKRLATGR